MLNDMTPYIQQLDLRQKIGQMMMVGFPGKLLNDDITSLIRDDFVGGVILFSRNIGSEVEVQTLTHDLQEMAVQTGHPFPLIIVIDQENGMVRRLDESLLPLPGNMALGAVDDLSITEHVAYHTGRVLANLGITMNLAPVVDVNHNPYNPVIGVRSFGSDPHRVARHGGAMIRGFHKAGIMAVAKHFPGHGDTHTDSHLELPVIHADLQRLRQFELVPFQRAVYEGVDAVMTAHIAFPYLTANAYVPATIAPEIVSLLRDDLRYAGVIISDCLEMQAIQKTVGTVEGALQALKAGVDILLISHTYALQKAAIERIVQAVKDGEVDEARIDASLHRIFKLKASSFERLGALNRAQREAEEKEENERERIHVFAEDVYRRAVTIVKDEKQFIPLHLSEEQTVLLFFPKMYDQSPVEDRSSHVKSWMEMIRSFHARIVAAQYDAYTGDILKLYQTVGEAVRPIHVSTENRWEWIEASYFASNDQAYQERQKIVDRVGVILVGTFNAHRYPKQLQLVERILKAWEQAYADTVPLVVVALREPYDGMVLSKVPTFVVTYEASQGALKALSQGLFGDQMLAGHLPVTLPEKDRI
ncbi:MAG: Beta-hexosaminidase [Candidatus Carbobacillus altaicus]|uniref:Beta-hexosaminidase n=1 Tax=Candidatus Carbonibacillus altaicus TaxID=2163959 RepID=A0A2R6XXI3_9BACL|nr:MAG: Beta-hexosaminidase [Candidatus Carbobacillus altaicus]